MNILKKHIRPKLESLSLTTIAILFSCGTLLLRVKLNKSIFYAFLVWNIFLAIIPYLITMYLSTKPKQSQLSVLVFGLIWLLFLPNAPYIITDFIHLKMSNHYMWWLDVLMLLSFSLTGLYLFYKSLNQMEALIKKTFKNPPLLFLRPLIFLLCGFGVYLGRFLRYNSWEILSQPQRIISDIIGIVFRPLLHKEVWLFTFVFGLFLWLLNWGFKTSSHHICEKR